MRGAKGNKGSFASTPVGCLTIAEVAVTRQSFSTKFDFSAEDKTLTGDEVSLWFLNQTKKAIILDPNPWDIRLD